LRACRPDLSGEQMPPQGKMTTQVILLVLGSVLLTTCANLTMRHGLVLAGGLSVQGDGIPGLVLRLAKQWTFVLGVVAYTLAALVWFRVLSIAEVSTSYPVLVGLTFAMVSVGAVLWFRESVSFLKAAGIAIIPAGIILVAKA
jgi:multidrug transporter EmrE-like cation transporter